MKMIFRNQTPFLRWRFGLLAGFAILIAACSEDATDPEGGNQNTGTVVSLEITAPSENLSALGETMTISAKARDGAGSEVSNAGISWTTSNASVISINSDNQPAGSVNITAIANGAANIIATSGDVNSTVTILVDQTVSDILAETSMAVEFPGDTARFSAIPVDARGNIVLDAAIGWRSRTTTVALVDSSGLVTARGFGRATIEITADAFVKDAFLEVIGNEFFLNGDIRLRYSLDLPDGSGGPFPAIVFAHGSGPITRGQVSGEMAAFVRRGIAVLRYDKRGVGESTGSFFNVGPGNGNNALNLLATDVAAGVEFLNNFPEIDQQRIGILGNSQGGWIGPLAALKTEKVSFMLMWSGPTVSIGLEIFYSNLADGTPTPLDSVYAQLSNFNGPHGYTPFSVLREIHVPSLWLYGGMDRSIPVRLDTMNMHRLQEAGNPYEYILYPYGAHDLRDIRTGQFVGLWDDYAAWMQEKGFLF